MADREVFLAGIDVKDEAVFNSSVTLMGDLLDSKGQSGTAGARLYLNAITGGVEWGTAQLPSVNVWSAGSYAEGDLVSHNDHVFQADTATSDTPGPGTDWTDLGTYIEYLGLPASLATFVPQANAGNQGQILTSDGAKWNPQSPPLLKVFPVTTKPVSATAAQNIGDLALVDNDADPDHGSLYVYEGQNIWTYVGNVEGPVGPALHIDGSVDENTADPSYGSTDSGKALVVTEPWTSIPAWLTVAAGDPAPTVGDLVFWDGAEWHNGGRIVGPQGDKGDQGDRGSLIFSGSGDPNVNNPTAPAGGFIQGDMYFDQIDNAQPFWWWDNNQWNQLSNDLTGPSGTLSVGTVTTGAAGTQATVTNSGTNTAAVFDFSIPQGDKGDQGDQAQFGTPTASGLAAGAAPTAAITGSGTTSAPYILALGIPKGDKGDQGDPALFGTPTVTGLAAGATPTVGITGTGATGDEYILALGIPEGDQGVQGPQALFGTPTVSSVAVGAGNTPGTPTVSITGTGATGDEYVLALGIPVGATGATPNLTIGTVTGVAPTSATAHGAAAATFTGTAAAPVLNLSIPQGLKGDKGDTGNSLEAAWGTTTNSELTITIKDHTGATVGTPITQDLVGPDGPVGPQGPQGIPGVGVSVLPPVADAAARNALTPSEGNLVLQIDTGEMWAYTGGAWIHAGQIVGPVGPAGPQGTPGVQGPQGIQGPVPLFSIPQVTTVAAGGTPTVGATGTGVTGDEIELTFGLVTGDTGATGPQGVKGDQGDSLSHAWVNTTELRIDITDAAGSVTQGTPVDLKGDKGDKGDAGINGVGLPEDPNSPGTPLWGTAGQLLATDAAATGAEWVDPPNPLPDYTGATTGQVLTVNAAGTGSEWADVDALPSGGNVNDFLELTATGAAWVAPKWDPAGTAATAAAAARLAAETTDAAALAAHEAAADPHPGYLTQTEGDARYPQFVLDANGHVPSANLPPLVVTDVHTVADRAAMLALTGVHRGDVTIIPAGADRGSYILSSDTPSNAADWHLLGGPSDVTSVNGQAGTVVLAAGNIGSTATGNLAATDVQAALTELDTDKVAKSGDTMSGHLTFGATNQVRITGAVIPAAGQVLTINAAGTGMEWAAPAGTKFAGNVTLTANTWATVNHALNDTDVVVQVRDGNAVVEVDIEIVDADNVRVRGTVAGTRRVVVTA